MSATTCRPRDHITAFGKRYPEPWKDLDSFRARRGRDGLPKWPNWCFCPMAAATAVLSRGVDVRVSAIVPDVPILSALAAWRYSQGIYRFDTTLFEELVATPLTGDIPCEVLHRLPEWCVYLETPTLPFAGAFVHLEWDANTHREELRLLLDFADPDVLRPMTIHLGDWPLEEAIARMLSETVIQADRHRLDRSELDQALPSVAEGYRSTLTPLLPLVLYLCSANAEIGTGQARPGYPAPTKTKHGPKWFPPDKPTFWDVGIRTGTTLRLGRQNLAAHPEPLPGPPHASPRPHLRRAHWHGYWSGPKAADVPRKFDLRWLPPTLVNAPGPEDLPTVVHPVLAPEPKPRG